MTAGFGLVRFGANSQSAPKRIRSWKVNGNRIAEFLHTAPYLFKGDKLHASRKAVMHACRLFPFGNTAFA